MEQRITLPKTEYGLLKAYKGSSIVGDESNFSGAVVEIIRNGVLGNLTDTGEAKNHLELIEAAEVVQSANDGVRDLVRGEDYIVNDGEIIFTDSYRESIDGKRTVRMNLGYRFLYLEVEGTTKVKKVPKTGDNSFIGWILELIG